MSVHKRPIVEHLELELWDEEEKVLGRVRKEEGYYKDFLLYTNNEEHIATVQPKVKLNSPSITIIDANGDHLIKATGNSPYDFRVYDCRKNKQISSIKRCSLVYETIKENLFDNDVYHLDNNHQESIITFALIGMVIALDIYFFPGL